MDNIIVTNKSPFTLNFGKALVTYTGYIFAQTKGHRELTFAADGLTSNTSSNCASTSPDDT